MSEQNNHSHGLIDWIDRVAETVSPYEKECLDRALTDAPGFQELADAAAEAVEAALALLAPIPGGREAVTALETAFLIQQAHQVDFALLEGRRQEAERLGMLLRVDAMRTNRPPAGLGGLSEH